MSTAGGVSADGSVVVGSSYLGGATYVAFIWTPEAGMRRLDDVLENDYGIDLDGWDLRSAAAVSADGTVIVGYGAGPSGETAWRAVLTPTTLTYTITARPDEVEVGDTITVSVKATNGLDVPLTDVRPDGPMEATSEDGVEVTLLTGPESATIAQLTPGASDSIRYTFVVAAAARGAKGGGPLGGLVEFSVGLLATDPDGETVEGTETCAEPPCGAVTVTAGLLVNSTDDDADEDPADDACDTGEEVEVEGEMVPECTLRAAIQESNGNVGAEEITFAIPGEGLHTIHPTSVLPTIDDPVVIDGTTQPGYDGTPLIFLDGSGAGEDVSGLRLVDNGDTPDAETIIRGLAIGNFDNWGIHVESGLATIEANHIGTNAAGMAALGNGLDGIYLEQAFSGTTIRDNVVSGNDSSGVYISFGGDYRVVGNRIGTNAAGTAALGNGRSGVEARGHSSSSAPPFTIGGPTPEEANLISGNGGAGVLLFFTQADIIGNYIGTNAAGTAALPNGRGGVDADDLQERRIEGNVISGNALFGLRLQEVETINGDGDPMFNTIVGNSIGTNADGTAALPNGGPGLWLGSGARGNAVGGSGDGEGNVISGNAGDGILLTSTDHPFTRNNEIVGNLIGTDATGTGAVPNGGSGVHADFRDAEGSGSGGYNDVIGPPGGPLTEGGPAGNVISGNVGPGVWVRGTCGAVYCTSINVEVAGNYIGTDRSGLVALGNGGPGVLIEEGEGVEVTVNHISANADGVVVGGDMEFFFGVPSLLIEQNLIGTDIRRRAQLGNAGDGIRLRFNGSTPRSEVEGDLNARLVSVSRNVIAGNQGRGLAVLGSVPLAEARFGPNTRHVDASGNRIGFAVTGEGEVAALPNGGAGVFLGEDARINTLDFNNIAFNLGGGIVVADGARHQVGGNLIFANAGIPIDLGNDGPTPNDIGDVDGGPNDGTNYPSVTEAYLASGEVFVRGEMDGRPGTNYGIGFYVDATDVEGFGAAQGFLDGLSVETPTLPDGDLHFREPFTARFASRVCLPSLGPYADSRGCGHPIRAGWRLRGLASLCPLLAETGFTNNICHTSELNEVYAVVVRAPETEEDAAAGDDEISLDGGDGLRGGAGYAAGDTLLVCPACANEETVTVAAVEATTLVLAAPLARAHAAGEAVVPFARAMASVLVRADTLVDFEAGTAATVRFAGVTGAGHVTVELFRRGPAETDGVAEETVLPHRWVASLDSTLAFADATELRIALHGIPALALEHPEDVIVYHRPTPGTGPFTALTTEFDTTAAVFVARGFTALGEFVLATDEDVDTGPGPEIPEAFALSSAYPNPFNPSTTLRLDLPEGGPAEVVVFDALGRRVAVLLDREMEAGVHLVRFEAGTLPSGVYLVRATAPGGTQVRAVTRLR
ncbi:MAG TPA: right-handed parallel beta-helix repeat-containing protein [Rubricoccaceae bacterium]|nr:right-handed parallel beta-helix repeat-containing protein [Rubricoccaceae bacterium]